MRTTSPKLDAAHLRRERRLRSDAETALEAPTQRLRRHAQCKWSHCGANRKMGPKLKDSIQSVVPEVLLCIRDRGVLAWQ